MDASHEPHSYDVNASEFCAFGAEMGSTAFLLITHAPQGRASLAAESIPKGRAMGILACIIGGMISGWLVGALMGSRRSGALADLLLGAIGALIGGMVATGLLDIADSIDDLSAITILASCVGAVIMVVLVKSLNSRRVSATE
jgi:uncharacterized membrane protein YeaQ/YmgE (transglycosylase-associated protein family)